MQISLIHYFLLNISSTYSLFFFFFGYICLQTRRLLKAFKAWCGCISYFSPAVMKHYDLRKLPKGWSIWAYGSREMSPPQQRGTAAGRHWARERSWKITCFTKNSEQREWTGSEARLYTLKTQPQWYTFSTKSTPPKHPLNCHQLGMPEPVGDISFKTRYLAGVSPTRVNIYKHSFLITS